MNELKRIIDVGVKATDESLDIVTNYWPDAITPIARMILTTIVQETARQAYEQGLLDGMGVK